MVDFTLGDSWIPFESLRHVPTILKYEDNFTKGYDLILCGVLTGCQMVLYYNGIKMFM